MSFKSHSLFKNQKKAFTLIEAASALLILAIGLVPVISLFISSSRTVEKGGLILTATIAAQNILDRAKSDAFVWNNLPITIDLPNQAYPQFTIPSFFRQKYNASGTLNISIASNHTILGTGEKEENLIQISVIIRWIEYGRLRTLRLITYRANINPFKVKTSTKF